MPDRLRRSGRRLAAPAVALALLAAAPVSALAGGSPKHSTGATATTATTATAAATTATAAATPATAAKAKAKAAGKRAHKAKPKPKPKPIPPLTGWLANSPGFPERTLILTPPTAAGLPANGVSVAENGTAVSTLHVTTAANAPVGRFGVMVVVDQGTSMSGSGLQAAMTAARGLVAAGSATQDLGLITYDAGPTIAQGLTPSAKKLNRALASTPPTADGDDPGPAVAQALQQLAAAKLTLGAVVLISDGVGVTPQHDADYAAIQAAVAAHTPVITFGVQDAATTPSDLRALAAAVPGSFVSTTPARLPSAVEATEKLLAADDLVSWRSRAGYSKAVQVTAGVAGVRGTVSAAYQSPAAPAPVKPHRHSSSPSAGTSTALSSQPSFVPPTPAQPSAPAPARGFWASPAAVPAVAGVCALLIALGLAALLYSPSRRPVRTRIESFIPIDPVSLELDEFVRPEGKRSRFARLQRSAWWPPFVEAVEISRSPHTPNALVKRAAAAAAVVAVLLTLVSGTVFVGLIALLAWPWVLRTLVYRAANKQRAKFCDSLPSYLQDIASSIRVGRSFVGALTIVAESADEPTRGELERAVTSESLGRPLEDALEVVSRRMMSSDMDQVALIAGLNRRTGSNVAESLDRVAEGARERADMRREMKALTAQAKMSSMVLTALPGVLLLGLSLLSPRYSYPLFHTTMGIVALSVGAVLVLCGWKVMSKITNVDGV